MGVTGIRRRLLVTGAAGHIGARFVGYLAERNDIDVRIVVRKDTDRTLHEHGELIVGDLANEAFCLEAAAGCNAIVHLASIPTAVTDSGLAVAAQTAMVRNLLTAAEAVHVARFVHLSTIHVYGDSLRGIVDESTTPSPISAYGAAHLAAERVVHSSGLSTSRLTLRCANGFGASTTNSTAPWGLVAGDLCMQAVRGAELRLHTHGRHQRDFIALSDVVRALGFFALESDAVGTIVLGSGRSMTLNDFALLVAERARLAFGRSYSVLCQSNDVSPALTYQLDTRRLQGSGFTPMNDFASEVDALLGAASARMKALS